jgi:predicted nucleotidyltransferase
MPDLTTASLTPTERHGLERFVELTREALGGRLHGIWLFGSRARGEEPGPESDVDVMVIAEGERSAIEDAVYDALAKVDRVTGYKACFSVTVWTPQWLAGRREIESFFVQEVDRDKIVLAGEP